LRRREPENCGESELPVDLDFAAWTRQFRD
jgi:hypothetical protein